MTSPNPPVANAYLTPEDIAITRLIEASHEPDSDAHVHAADDGYRITGARDTSVTKDELLAGIEDWARETLNSAEAQPEDYLYAAEAVTVERWDEVSFIPETAGAVAHFAAEIHDYNEAVRQGPATELVQRAGMSTDSVPAQRGAQPQERATAPPTANTNALEN